MRATPIALALMYSPLSLVPFLLLHTHFEHEGMKGSIS